MWSTHHNPTTTPSFSPQSPQGLTDSIAANSIHQRPLRQRRAPQKLGLLRAPLPSLPGRERRTAPRFRGRAAGASGTGSSDNAALCPGQTSGPPGTWARVREGHVSSNQQQARIAGPCPRHPAMHRHKMGPLSERPRPPAPAALRGSSQRVRPKRQSVAQTGPFIAASSLRASRAVPAHVPRRAPLKCAAARRNSVAVDFKHRFTNWKSGP